MKISFFCEKSIEASRIAAKGWAGKTQAGSFEAEREKSPMITTTETSKKKFAFEKLSFGCLALLIKKSSSAIQKITLQGEKFPLKAPRQKKGDELGVMLLLTLSNISWFKNARYSPPQAYSIYPYQGRETSRKTTKTTPKFFKKLLKFLAIIPPPTISPVTSTRAGPTGPFAKKLSPKLTPKSMDFVRLPPFETISQRTKKASSVVKSRSI
eukprot:TRINITY_DN12753_c0_g1_i2.p3 TRINITY_DN12753_c0_g1~~TRINITY_DN12753_c0_g1_i2.p3  ORF type:complete len:211 (-),score=3.83 TRINITY_DN12753_c0_g1_i2:897-1529(-)